MTDPLIPPVDMRTILPTTGSVKGKSISAIDLSRTAKPKADEVIEQFQGVLLGEMMKAMRSTVPESPLFGGEGMGGEMFQSLLDQEYIGAAGHQMGGLGLTEALKRQLGLENEAKSDQKLPVVKTVR